MGLDAQQETWVRRIAQRARLVCPPETATPSFARRLCPFETATAHWTLWWRTYGTPTGVSK